MARAETPLSPFREALGSLQLLGMIGAGAIILSGPLLLLHHIWQWLSSGVWPGYTLGGGLNGIGLGVPHTSLVGLQRILDWIGDCQLWIALTMLMVAAGGLVTWISDRLDRNA